MSQVRKLCFLLAVAVLAAPSLLLSQCGVERWSVKTGTDPDAGKVNLNSSTNTTIASLRAAPAPSPIPSNNRVSPTETTVWVINATLTQYKLENDSDYHLVFADSSGLTMIMEIPSPTCVGSTSPFLSAIQNARAKFDAQFTATTSFQTANIPVQIVGVGMFDFLHGQTGVAPNGIELHPVLDIIFNPGTQTPDFILSTTPSTLSVAQGSSGTTRISTTVAGGFNSAISLSTSGLPSGVTASLSPTSIAAPGNGSSTLTLTAASTAPTGTFNVTATATGGGITHTATVALSISTAGGTGGTTTQLLGNPGFENGSTNPAPWTASSGVINNSASEPPHGGTWDAWLDGYGTTHTDTLTQQVSIPSTATSASLSFWLHIDTAETSTTTAFDTLAVQVRNSSGTVLSTLKTFSNLNKNTGFTQQSFDLTSFKGQTIQINFVGTEDASAQTSFVLDDFSLNVTTPSTTDTTPPTVSVTSPTNGATVSGTVTVNASASDNVGVTQMQLLIDGTLVASNTNATALSFSWSTPSVTNGSHSIVAKAFDAAGNVGTSSTITVTVSNGAPTTSELIVNGGFENGSTNPAPWTVTSGVVSNSTSEAAHSGTWKAWLDGYGTAHTDTAMQQVTIPAGATAATLSFWLHVDTAETSTTTAFDKLTLQVRDSSGKVLSTLATFSNLNHATGYQQHSFDLTSFRGQIIQIFFSGVEDSSLQTSFVLDDISLQVTQ
ncbi:MAG TPA: Ig-like domain-containing protein [Candidatus Limnocylindrales bacterium]|nr:Ig-like domain-containing protein [Candidatus Limnocylindrales bacterium]